MKSRIAIAAPLLGQLETASLHRGKATYTRSPPYPACAGALLGIWGNVVVESLQVSQLT